MALVPTRICPALVRQELEIKHFLKLVVKVYLLLFYLSVLKLLPGIMCIHNIQITESLCNLGAVVSWEGNPLIIQNVLPKVCRHALFLMELCGQCGCVVLPGMLISWGSEPWAGSSATNWALVFMDTSLLCFLWELHDRDNWFYSRESLQGQISSVSVQLCQEAVRALFFISAQTLSDVGNW